MGWRSRRSIEIELSIVRCPNLLVDRQREVRNIVERETRRRHLETRALVRGAYPFDDVIDVDDEIGAP
jgi:hypothetical protein